MQPTATDRRGGRLPVVGIQKEPVGQDLDPGSQIADPIRHRAGQVGVAVIGETQLGDLSRRVLGDKRLRRSFRDDATSTVPSSSVTRQRCKCGMSVKDGRVPAVAVGAGEWTATRGRVVGGVR